jgi:EAL domain-containing protein (putative c-di-GMP-specific phosphodiesterase class I)
MPVDDWLRNIRYRSYSGLHFITYPKKARSALGEHTRPNSKGPNWMQSDVEILIPSNSIPPGSRADSSVWLLVRGDSDDQQQQIPVTPFPFVIGRRPGSSLQINSRAVSGTHAILHVEGEELWIQDLQSTNGTYINGTRIRDKQLLNEGDLVQLADVVFRLRRSQQTTSCHTLAEDVCDGALALVQFDRLMQSRLVCPFFQPIVDIRSGAFVGYEVLARSRVFGLESCQAMFDAASRLNMEVELSRMLRWEGVRAAMPFKSNLKIFLNTHPLEINHNGLIDSMITARQLSNDLPIVLEVHEASITDPSEMQELREQLRDLGIELAYDDFGAGQTRLSELIEAPPDYLKFDMSLIRGIEKAPVERQRMLGSLVRIVIDLGINPLAEGIETSEEAEVCRSLGFQTAQGFYFGRPAPLESCG